MKLGFYLVTDIPLERAVAQIAAKVLAGGDRMLLVSEDADLRDRLDKALWTEEPQEFLAHGQAGGTHDARQPILISAYCEPVNDAQFIAFADGRWREEAQGFTRAFLFFDESGRDAARQTWKALEDRDGLEREFFAREDGRWSKKG